LSGVSAVFTLGYSSNISTLCGPGPNLVYFDKILDDEG
jgi:hypothetical protein